MKNETNEPMHERLCAYIFGEVGADERAEIERELDRSPQLRAEQARIEATIGLVRDAMGGSESLSPTAHAEVLSAAAPRPVPWYSQNWVRMAASIAVIAGGYLALHAMHEANVSTNSVTEFARLEERKQIRGEGEREAVKEQLPVANKPAELAKTDRDTSELAAASVPSAKPAAETVKLEDQLLAPDSPGKDAFGLKAKTTVEELEVLDRKSDSFCELIVQAPTLTPADSKKETLLVGAAHSPTNYSVQSSAGVRGPVPATRPAPFGGRRLGPGSTYHGPGDSTPPSSAPSGSGGKYPVIATAEEKSRRGAVAESQQQTTDAVRKLEQLDKSAGKSAGADEFMLQNGKSVDVSGGFDEPELRGQFLLGFNSAYYHSLSLEQRAQFLDDQCQSIIVDCRPRPHEHPRDMYFRFWGDNPFELAALDSLSTFSVDVDTASYSLARRYLVEGHIPEKAQVRTEEFVNYFKADVAAPTQGTFAIHTDLAPSRFSADQQRWMMRVVVRGREVSKLERKPLRLTFVIDCSGSMREQSRLDTVKDALRIVLSQLNAGDAVGLVAFSTEARQILPMTNASQRGLIEASIAQLAADGWTNSEAGLALGYQTALQGLDANATNRVVFLSDGQANVGVTDPAKLSEAFKPLRQRGVHLNTIGVGMNNHNDVLLEQLADKGEGMCSYLDDLREAKRALVDNFMGAFEPIARDAKIQVEFDPAQVYRYRLLGYENRAIADADFRNDKVEAGEVGAGHQVTALYEIERTNQASEKPLAKVHLRWKQPRRVNMNAVALGVPKDAEEAVRAKAGQPTGSLDSTKALAGLGYLTGSDEEATEIEQPVLASSQTSFEGAGPGYRRAVLVAQFAEILRRSTHARGEPLEDLIAEARKLDRELHEDGEFHEFVLLVERSKQLIQNALPICDEMCQTVDELRQNEILRTQCELLARAEDHKLIDDLRIQNQRLEQRIRELLRRRYEMQMK